MAMFIRVEVDPQAARDGDLAKKLIDACPVNIFEQASDGGVRIVGENEDECTLCELCLQAAPDGRVKVWKLYEEPPAQLVPKTP